MIQTKVKLRFISFLPGIALFILIYILLTLPGNDFPKNQFLELIHFDKWVHTGLFASLVFLFCYPLLALYSYKNFFYFIVVVSAIAYGIAMEYVQKYFTVDRSFDVTDMIADAAGAFLGYLFFRFIAARMTEKNKPL